MLVIKISDDHAGHVTVPVGVSRHVHKLMPWLIHEHELYVTERKLETNLLEIICTRYYLNFTGKLDSSPK